jgi:hypothetical protein
MFITGGAVASWWLRPETGTLARAARAPQPEGSPTTLPRHAKATA